MKDERTYEEAVRLYKASDLKRTDLCRMLDLDYNTFSYYLKTRHPELVRINNPKKGSEYARSQRKETERKYSKALQLCEKTDLSYKEIADITGVSLTGLKTYIRKNHRELLLRRQGLNVSRRTADTLKLRNREGGQTVMGHEKYKDAIAACEDLKYIMMPVSQIASEFGVSETGLLAQLRDHFPEINEQRENIRRNMGLANNHARGVRQSSLDEYALAIQELRETEKTIEEVAEEFGVSLTGLRSHLLSYHKDVVKIRRHRQHEREALNRKVIRAASMASDSLGTDVEEKYALAVETLKEGDRSVEAVAKEYGYLPETFRDYLKRHQPELYTRFGRKLSENGKQVLARSAEKYAPAILEWKESGLPLKEIAAKHGLVYNSLSAFVRRNYPKG